MTSFNLKIAVVWLLIQSTSIRSSFGGGSPDFDESDLAIMRQFCKYAIVRTGLCNQVLPNPTTPKPLINDFEQAKKYLGVGYNVVNSNPIAQKSGTNIDPGFVATLSNTDARIFELEEADFTAVPVSFCHDDPTVIDIPNFHSFKHNFLKVFLKTGDESAADVIKHEGPDKVTDFQNIRRQFVRGGIKFFYTRCTSRNLYFSADADERLTQSFMSAVMGLPREYSPNEPHASKFREFFAQYGTHYTAEVSVGYVKGAGISLTTLSESNSFDQERAKMDFLAGSAWISGRQAFYFYIGNRTQSGQLGRIAPVRVMVKSLTSLFTDEFFPSNMATPKELADRRKALELALNNYCSLVLQGRASDACNKVSSRAPSPVFGGMYQISDCLGLDSLPNSFAKHGDTMFGCVNGYKPALAASIRWNGDSETCKIDFNVCVDSKFSGFPDRPGETFGGIFIRYNSKVLEEEFYKTKRCSKQDNGFGNKEPACMQSNFGAFGVLLLSKNVWHVEEKANCPPSFTSNVFGKYYAWEWVICLRNVTASAGSELSSKPMVSKGYQLETSAQKCPKDSVCRDLSVNKPGCAPGFKAVLAGMMGRAGYGVAEQYLCMSEHFN